MVKVTDDPIPLPRDNLKTVAKNSLFFVFTTEGLGHSPLFCFVLTLLYVNQKKKNLKKTKIQNLLSIFYQNSFQFSNFIFVHFSTLTFKFIQLKSFHQFLLTVVINFPIFKIFLQIN